MTNRMNHWDKTYTFRCWKCRNIFIGLNHDSELETITRISLCGGCEEFQNLKPHQPKTSDVQTTHAN